ncbi:MAG TPA: PKD domain-containing protein [Thermoanaerobaculia bacterium]|nr:PKD domain-containing protein [Thermoanaerobaculia bacterium]
MKKQWVLIVLALCLSLFGSTHLSLAQDFQESSDDTLARMQQEGWKIVKDGVLQRELVAGEIESFVFGVPGFTWKLQDLQKQLQNLQRVFKATPTPELRRAIASHRKEIANARKTLALARLSEASGETGIEKVSCTISFAYNASASYNSSPQGTFGNASANFSSNCAFYGEVYAYAFAKTTVNGAPTTHTVTDGPRSGANVSASAYATVNGGPACESYAFGSMTSNSLNPSSYSMQSTNAASCPVPQNPAPVPTINGPSYLGVTACTTYTWTASVSNGTAPFAYQWTWNGTAVGTGSSYSRQYCPGINYTYNVYTLGLTVTDSASRTGSASKSVEVERYGSGGGGGGCGSSPCP